MAENGHVADLDRWGTVDRTRPLCIYPTVAKTGRPARLGELVREIH